MGELTDEFLKECGLGSEDLILYAHPNSDIDFRIEDNCLVFIGDNFYGIKLGKPISKRIDFVRLFSLLTGIMVVLKPSNEIGFDHAHDAIAYYLSKLPTAKAPKFEKGGKEVKDGGEFGFSERAYTIRANKPGGRDNFDYSAMLRRMGIEKLEVEFITNPNGFPIMDIKPQKCNQCGITPAKAGGCNRLDCNYKNQE